MSVTTTTDGPVLVVAIDRPEVKNAIDLATADALVEAFTAVEGDDDVSVAVLTGSGDTFCAGFDLSVAAAGVGYDPDGRAMLGVTRTTPTKPVIAAVEGYAVAGGLELALWCDLRVASSTAVFGVFCRRWGVPLIDGGTVRLPRLIGMARALDLVLTGRPVDAQEALDIGLATRVCPPGRALAVATELAATIIAFPAPAMLADRAGVHAAFDHGMEEALLAEHERGTAAIAADGMADVARFTAGEGRGGTFS